MESCWSHCWEGSASLEFLQGNCGVNRVRVYCGFIYCGGGRWLGWVEGTKESTRVRRAPFWTGWSGLRRTKPVSVRGEPETFTFGCGMRGRMGG